MNARTSQTGPPVGLQTGRKIVLKQIPGKNGICVAGVQNHSPTQGNASCTLSSSTKIVTSPTSSSSQRTPTFVYVLNKNKPLLPNVSSHNTAPGSVTLNTNSGCNSSSSILHAESIKPSASTFPQSDTSSSLPSAKKCSTSRPIVVNIYDGPVDNIGDEADEENINGDTESYELQQNECKIEITLRNVVCTFSTRCHLNLREITQTGANVIFKSAQNLVEMKIRHPKCTAFLFSSGKITCTGCDSEENARIAGKKFAYYLKRRGYPAKFCNYRVVNVMATCAMPFTIRLAEFARAYPKITSYEPEINPGVTCRFVDIKASLKVFTSGKITVTAPSAAAAENAIQLVYPLVFGHKREDIVPSNIYDFELDEDGSEDFDDDYMSDYDE